MTDKIPAETTRPAQKSKLDFPKNLFFSKNHPVLFLMENKV